MVRRSFDRQAAPLEPFLADLCREKKRREQGQAELKERRTLQSKPRRRSRRTGSGADRPGPACRASGLCGRRDVRYDDRAWPAGWRGAGPRRELAIVRARFAASCGAYGVGASASRRALPGVKKNVRLEAEKHEGTAATRAIDRNAILRPLISRSQTCCAAKRARRTLGAALHRTTLSTRRADRAKVFRRRVLYQDNPPLARDKPAGVCHDPRATDRRRGARATRARRFWRMGRRRDARGRSTTSRSPSTTSTTRP